MPLKGRNRVERELRDRAEQLARALILEAAKRIILRTPVDTGRARANWQVVIGSPSPVLTAGTDRSGREGIAKAQQVAAEVTLDDEIYIVNGLAYIPALEDGHSDQAPDGMIAVTVAELQPLVDHLVRMMNG